MEDMWNSVKAYLYERASNPFGVTFVVSWLVWNFRVVMIVLSDDELHSKFHYLDSYFSLPHPIMAEYSISSGGYFVNSLIAPLVITLLYVFASPLLSYPVYKFSLWYQTKMLNLKKQSDGLVMLTEKEARDLRVKMAGLKRKYENELDEANKLNDALNEKLSELGYQPSESEENDSEGSEQTVVPEQAEPATENLSEVQEAILRFFSTNDVESANRTSVLRGLDYSNLIVSQALHELKSGQYIYLSADQDRIRLKPRGREYIINKGL